MTDKETGKQHTIEIHANGTRESLSVALIQIVSSAQKDRNGMVRYCVKIELDPTETRQVDLLQIPCFFAYLKESNLLDRVSFCFWANEAGIKSEAGKNGKTDNKVSGEIKDMFIHVHRMLWCIYKQQENDKVVRVPKISYNIKDEGAFEEFSKAKKSSDSDIPNDFIPAIPVNNSSLNALTKEISQDDITRVFKIENDKYVPIPAIDRSDLKNLYIAIAQRQFRGLCADSVFAVGGALHS